MKALAVLQVVAGLSYLVQFCAALLAPTLYRTLDPICGLVSTLGETPAMLWLALAGAKLRAPAVAPAASSATAGAGG